MLIEILYEDKDLLVVGKPSGVVVNRADSVKSETIEDWAEKKLAMTHSRNVKHIPGMGSLERAGIVHRLDKETSGALIVAKNVESFEKLQLQFKERIVKKTYIALTHDNITVSEGEINVPVARSIFNRHKFTVSALGKTSQTKFKVLDHYILDNQKYTLIEAYPKTGRTHQIRVHFQYFGHALVCDMNYTGRKRYKKDITWCPRLFLHAKRIEFNQPKTNKHIIVDQALPEDLKVALSKLTKI